MLFGWILKLIGLGFLLGSGWRMGSRPDQDCDEEKLRRMRRRVAARLRRIADAIAKVDAESGSGAGE